MKRRQDTDNWKAFKHIIETIDTNFFKRDFSSTDCEKGIIQKPGKVFAAYRNIFPIGVRDLIYLRRFQYAERLLSNPACKTLTFYQLARLVGFESENSFYARLKRFQKRIEKLTEGNSLTPFYDLHRDFFEIRYFDPKNVPRSTVSDGVQAFRWSSPGAKEFFLSVAQSLVAEKPILERFPPDPVSQALVRVKRALQSDIQTDLDELAEKHKFFSQYKMARLFEAEFGIRLDKFIENTLEQLRAQETGVIPIGKREPAIYESVLRDTLFLLTLRAEFPDLPMPKVDEMADRAEVSRNTIHGLFKRITGLPYADFVATNSQGALTHLALPHHPNEISPL